MPKASLPPTAPRALYAFGCALLLLGGLLTPELLSEHGVMRRSLTGVGLVSWEQPHAEHIRRMALLQIGVGRGLLALVGALLVGIGLGWRRLRELTWVRNTLAHEAVQQVASWSAAQVGHSMLGIMLGSVASVFALNLAFARGMLAGSVTAIAREDGIIEQLTAVGFLIASVLVILAARRARGLPRVVQMLFGAGLFVCFGEELSWGQRVFDIDSSALRSVNVQGELNLHNMMGKSTNVIFLLLWTSFGVLPAVLSKLHPFLHNALDRLGVPIATPALVLGVLVSWLLFDPIAHRIAPPSELRFEECIELLAALWFVLLGLCMGPATAPQSGTHVADAA